MTSPTPTTPEALAACEKARAAFNAAAGEPKRGDRVRVTLEATFRAPNDVNGGVFIETDLGTYNIPQVVSVEVLAPAKPPEPGRYGVVVARDGREWIRFTTSERSGYDWCRPGTGPGGTEYARWDDLDVIRVVREGVRP